ncbi:pectate lyase, PelA/Pel-15E family [Fibrobacter sp. UWB16]|uniref:pectate lyase n=1 Tax=unclassified Fibrobacter TaxID=2634177 RepID=UPI000B523547|nr:MULTISPECIES: pectate lyase [unclassified Fibrobacter]OWV18184.1 pectate lyase [Fibrobacter sp. UWB3]SOD17231.1 pectate lyase, PelA/Pel-15E family [Fibrobacter sp. UWB16]
MKNFGFGNYKFFVAAMSVASFSFAATYAPPSTAVSKINSYRGYSELTSAASGMDIDQYTYNMTTWQIANGGFYKAMADKYKSAYGGGQKSEWRAQGGADLGTIDNNATIQEIRLLAVRYKETTNNNYKSAFKTSFNKAVNFLLTMQRSKGGLPQVWPKRGNYSDQITLNDNAMIRAMVTMMDIANKTSPFDSDIIDDATRSKMKSALDKAVDYLLKAQIVNDGKLTVWCAQHDTNSLAPVGARAYELASKSGNESMGVVWFLMNWPDQNEAVQKAVKGAIAWYRKNKLKDKAFSKTAGVVDKAGSSLWFRFYEVNNDNYFFCDRDGASTKTQDFMKISEERRKGYQWAGDYGSAILGTENAYLEALAKMDDNYVPPPPAPAMCGNDTCKTYIDGVDFIDIQGVKETTNTGFVGEGYANVDNSTGSYVTYGVTALKSGKYTLFISFANGGGSARGYSVSAGDKTLLADGSMESTAAWTTWKVQSIEIELPQGYSELKFTSLSKDGMANIDYIGWMSDDLKAGKVEIPPTSIEAMRTVHNAQQGNRYFVDFGRNNNSAGAYFTRSNGKTYRVNGRNAK